MLGVRAQPVGELARQLAQAFRAGRGDRQRRRAGGATVVRNDGIDAVIEGRGQQGGFATSGVACHRNAGHAVVVDLAQGIDTALQAPGPDRQTPAAQVGPVLKHRAFSLCGVVVKSQFGAVEPGQRSVLLQCGRNGVVAHNMGPASIRAEQHWAALGVVGPDQRQGPADPGRLAHTDAPQLQLAVGLQEPVHALCLHHPVMRHEAPKQGLESCEVWRRMRRRKSRFIQHSCKR